MLHSAQLPAAPGAPAQRSTGSGARRWCGAGAVVLLSLAVFLALSLGAMNLSPSQVLDGLFDTSPLNDRTIVWELRLPRVLLALARRRQPRRRRRTAAGRHPQPARRPARARPHGGGALAASIAIKVSPDVPAAASRADRLRRHVHRRGVAVRPLVARRRLAGAARALRRRAIGRCFTAGINALLVTSNLSTQTALSWLAGGFFGRGWDDLRVTWPYCVAGLIAALLLSRNMNILALGDEPAQSLGLSVERTRVLAIATAALLAGASVAAAGMVAFVGLVIPHIARSLIGDDHRKLIPLSALLGASLVVYADTSRASSSSPSEIPLGIVTAVVGAPFLLYLVRAKT